MNDLPVGHPIRRTAKRALLAAFVIAATFALVTIVSKQDTTLNVQQPWQDDPYDVPVSLDFAVLPVLITSGHLRSALCRADQPLPARRLFDLLRVADTALAACLITEAAQWVAVILREHRPQWGISTVWQIGLLALLTAGTLGAEQQIRRTTKALSATTIGDQPDWLTDATTLAMIAATATHSPRLTRHVHWIDTRVTAQIRRKPLVAAALFATGIASPFIGAKILIEHYPPVLVLVVSVFVCACMFTIVVVAGSYLHVVANTGNASAQANLALGACTGAATLFAFHDSLLPHQTTNGLALLLLIGAIAGGAIAGSSHLVRRSSR